MVRQALNLLTYRESRWYALEVPEMGKKLGFQEQMTDVSDTNVSNNLLR